VGFVIVLARAFGLGAVVAALAACQPATTPTVPIDQTFELRVGASAAVAGTSMTVRFDEVTGDLRCPIDAFCILGGSATVRITVIDDRGTFPYEIKTASDAPVRHHDTAIQLVELLPFPFSTRITDPEDYRATLRVTK
jgi:hypothetical protein